MTSQTSPYRTVLYFLALDIIGLITSFYLAFLIRFDSKTPNWSSPVFWLVILTYLIVFYALDVYRLKVTESRFHSANHVFKSIALTVWLLTAFIQFCGLWKMDPMVGRGILLLSSIIFTAWSLGYRYLLNKSESKNSLRKKWLVLGDKNKLLRFASDNHAFDSRNLFYLNGYFEDLIKYPSERNASSYTKTGLIFSKPWSGILIDDAECDIPQCLHDDLIQARFSGKEVYRFGDFCEHYLQKIPPEMVRPSWFAYSEGFSLVSGHMYSHIKRFFDSLFALSLLILTFPLLLLVTIAIKLDSPGPLLYSQTRKGHHGKPYKIYKFRSMYTDSEKHGAKWATVGDRRITRIGRIIRKIRIDEIPQLWNILNGEMSLIGPRPERPEFDDVLVKEIPYYHFRYLVKPGVTGWSQVKFGYGNTLEDSANKVAYDLFYIKNHSLFLDILIILKTIRVVLFAQGV
ncbi:exopolysaccharide biosynthesis polyprenyl glycosylphosphotransferase [Acaryochloris marina]|uniref:exopolysaccharide biosynthesis polyprenyl glycosylphosphotransferase n=1 Tax=Acaryochloris marina TaxID=155978 RepID=UPI001BAF4C50|nr:exopolysaccharide biosynthesis polyprenyl glycosylphosphotransferase [Acaryochloris marina]QUY44993.1 exopolysaccharide biosynthesis polyprenyl glycosylphosphotransferase [Acaryochloris marina S15]